MKKILKIAIYLLLFQIFFFGFARGVKTNGQKSTQDFTWGVLTINTNKSIYLPNEKAKLSMGVLDETGMMVCDVKLKLTIKENSQNINDELTTENGKIIVNPECQIHGFTEKPDYEASYQVKGPGRYEIILTAETKKGSYTITDFFEVKENVRFDVERDMATRIYPPKTYPVTFNIIANQDFVGTITETVPESFDITPSPTERSYDNISSGSDLSKILTWNVSLKKGEKITLGYQFDAPDISPQFYLLGPLQFMRNDTLVLFEEARQWQIATDATITYVKASTGATDAGGAWSYTTSAPSAADNLIIVQVFQDGTSASNAVTITSATNVENLAGTDNVFTALAATGSAVGSATAGYQYIFIGRALNTSAIVITGANSGTDDIYVRVYEFSGVAKGTTLAKVIENGTAGSFANGVGTSTTCADTGVTTLGDSRLALNFVALADDAMGLAAFAGQTGGTWALPVAIYETATGTDGTLGLNTASIASAGTIDGGSDTVTSIAWGVVGFALIPEFTPTVTLSTPTNTQTISDTTPALVFTGTDLNSDEIEYNVQVDTVNSFDSQTITIASNSENTYDADGDFYYGTPGQNEIGQTFTTTGSVPLTSVKFYLKKSASPTGNISVDLKATSAGLPSGSVLATSSTFDVSTLTTSYQLITFTFSTPYTLSASTMYALILTAPLTTSSTNKILVGSDEISSGYTGGTGLTYVTYVTSALQISTNDLVFYAYSVTPFLDKVSDTDSHTPWVGTGDPHPWPSGNAVTYTVQTALPWEDTYYWRVRAKDPDGSNTWGAWTDPFSFYLPVAPTPTPTPTPAPAPPNTPSLDLPTNTATNQSCSPVLKTTATDPNGDYVKYKIQICTDAAMTEDCRTIIQ